jgi:hypothetical protein
MWDKADESFDYVITAPDKAGNIKVKLTYLPTGTTATKICAKADLEATKAELREQVTEEAKKTLEATKDAPKGSSAKNIAS